VDLGISRVFSIIFYCKLVDEELYKRKTPLIWQIRSCHLKVKGTCYPPSCTRMDLQLSYQRLNIHMFKIRVQKSSRSI
jgi:ribosomal protein L37AE/L43A